MQPTNFINKFLLWFEVRLTKFIDWYGVALDGFSANKVTFTIITKLAKRLHSHYENGNYRKRNDGNRRPGQFKLNLEYDKSITVQQNNIQSQKIEKLHPFATEVATLFSNVAGPTTGMGSLGVGEANKSEANNPAQTREKNGSGQREEFMKFLRKDIYQSTGANVSMSVLITKKLADKNHVEWN